MNALDRARAEGREAFGTICVVDGYVTSQLAACSGADVILLDKQHAAFDWSQLETSCWRIRSAGAAVYVRTASLDPAELNLVADLPLDGMMLPNVSSLAEAEGALRSVRFPPDGDRSVGNVRTSILMGTDFRDAQDPRAGLLIEHIGAVEQIDQILDLGLCDFVMVGPHDLAASMGIDVHTETTMPRALVDAIASVRASAEAHEVGWWQWAGSVEAASDRKPGEVLLWSLDGLIMQDAFRAGFGALRGDAPS
jgi:4-hydroxy-2-oxoheptanedioate aldolase